MCSRNPAMIGFTAGKARECAKLESALRAVVSSGKDHIKNETLRLYGSDTCSAEDITKNNGYVDAFLRTRRDLRGSSSAHDKHNYQD
jgi:hypothetical protein